MHARSWVTTTEAARLLGLSPMTVIRRFDEGDLVGFRVPGSRFRRIPKENLKAYAQQHGIPIRAPDMVDESAGSIPDGAEEGTAEPDARTTGRRALAVEDEPELLKFFARYLRAEGWDVRTADNGFDAGFQAARFQPHLVILDIMLPGLDGREVCRRMRREPSLADTKILAVTALRDNKSKAEIFAAGADAYLQKPFTVKGLQEHICSLITTHAAVGCKGPA